MQANILRKHLAATLIFAAESDVRYYLNGVLIEVRDVEIRCAATTGHIAGVCRLLSEQEPMPDVIVPSATLKQALLNKSEVLMLEFENGKWLIGGVSFTPIDGKFPEYRRIIPNKCNGVAAQFNPASIAAAAKAGKALGIKNAPIIRHNGNDAAQVQFYGCDDFVGVFMPFNPFTGKTPDTGLIQWGSN